MTERREHRIRVALLASALAIGCSAQEVADPPAEPRTDAATSCAGATDESDVVPGSGAALACSDANYTLTRDIAYATGRSQRFDLYLPRSERVPYPTVIWVHGGGWQGGDKASIEQPRRLLCQGYAVASVNYRLSGEAIFPAQVQDVKAAIRHLRANAASLGLDPQRFAVFGSSAGGHLAALVATSAGEASFDDPALGNASVSSAVQAAVDWYGPIDLLQMDSLALAQGCRASNHGQPGSPESKLVGCTVNDPGCAEAVRRTSPLTYLGSGAPPILILHGPNDCTVARGQSLLLRDALRAAGSCASFRTVTGAGHGGPEWQTAPVQDQVADFLDATFGR